jgi:integrase
VTCNTALGIALDNMTSKQTAAGQQAHHRYGLACIRFIALTGTRRGEAINLRWDELDIARGTMVLGDTKTGESIRPLSQAVIELLQGLERISEFVFASYPNGPAYGALPNLWRKVAAAATTAAGEMEQPSSFASITLHSLRHSFAGVAEGMGASLPTIAALLGHRLGGVTAGYVLKRIDRPLLMFSDQLAAHIDFAMRGGGSVGQVIHIADRR